MDMKTKPLPEKLAGLRVNGQRLWDSLMELARIGATAKGGVCRLTLTDPRWRELFGHGAQTFYAFRLANGARWPGAEPEEARRVREPRRPVKAGTKKAGLP